MSQSKSRKKKAPKRVLALPDLDHAKTAVLNSLTSTSGQRTYDHAIREFVAWYCSEPRLAFNRTVALRYRIHLEQRHYAPATINLRLAAVRRIAYEAADAGLLSPELAAGIRRVKGVRPLGVRVGNNWLTSAHAHAGGVHDGQEHFAATLVRRFMRSAYEWTVVAFVHTANERGGRRTSSLMIGSMASPPIHGCRWD